MKFIYDVPKGYRVHRYFTRAVPNIDLYVWDIPNKRFALRTEVHPLNSRPWAICKTFKAFKRLCRKNPLVFENGNTLKLLNGYEISNNYLDITACG